MMLIGGPRSLYFLHAAKGFLHAAKGQLAQDRPCSRDRARCRLHTLLPAGARASPSHPPQWGGAHPARRPRWRCRRCRPWGSRSTPGARTRCPAGNAGTAPWAVSAASALDGLDMQHLHESQITADDVLPAPTVCTSFTLP